MRKSNLLFIIIVFFQILGIAYLGLSIINVRYNVKGIVYNPIYSNFSFR